ncbi:MAG: hypothetical protein WJ306_04405 [Ferrovum myxofaciens]
MPIPNETSARDRWSRLRLLIIGQLLAAPPRLLREPSLASRVLDARPPDLHRAHPSLNPLAQAIRTQYADRPKWNIQLHYDNLRLVFGANEFPSYATVLRFFRAQGLWRVRDPRSGPQRTAVPDGTREVRSFEATMSGPCFIWMGIKGLSRS